MKAATLIAFSLAVVLSAPSVWAGTEAKTTGSDDHAAIEAAARDYIEGWYDGDAERMARGLHPDLAKRTARSLPNGRDIISTLSYNSMVEYTKAGFGKEKKKANQVNEVIILDVSSVTASVKSVSYEYIDYLHLAKVDGQWRIVNVLWEPNKAETEAPE